MLLRGFLFVVVTESLICVKEVGEGSSRGALEKMPMHRLLLSLVNPSFRQGMREKIPHLFLHWLAIVLSKEPSPRQSRVISVPVPVTLSP